VEILDDILGAPETDITVSAVEETTGGNTACSTANQMRDGGVGVAKTAWHAVN